ncbi:HDOD domain-containing protein [Marinobacter sp.]|uniref:HDOD domain-containing protein n=1 Tax=Marinobacter sp. TaxID=50741 RepID=UPI002B49EBC0|nr:HDOD domain-containing protein [Marinobacter sp.]HKK54959.1 HDOD domain-containing protein [Marinobacter sp.]
MKIAPDIQLPSLPEVTLRALEACDQEESYRTISEIVSVDTALVSAILGLANSSVYGVPTQTRSVDQALLRLGTHRFHTLVLTAALRQILLELGADQWQQLRDFWRHSLTTAMTARALATLTRYPEPDQAFMLGMLHNVGELIALKTPPGDARQYCLDHQPEIASKLVSDWGLGPMASDAMLYQRAMPADIRDAGHLTKLISLATQLAQSDAAGIAAAATVFGLNEELTRQINRRIGEEVEGVARSMGISLAVSYDSRASHEKLKQTVLHRAMANQAMELAPVSDSTQECLAATVTSMTLITGLPCLYFGAVDNRLRLYSASNGEVADLSVSANPASSLLTETYSTARALVMGDREPSVLDRQLMNLLHTPSLVTLPVRQHQHCLGVFVIGTDARGAEQAKAMGHLLCTLLSRTLDSIEAGLTNHSTTDAELAEHAIRRQVHEVSNPLTIVRQYIYQLRGRLDDADVHQQLDVIREELDRAGALLLQMGKSWQSPGSGPTDGCNLNEELKLLRDLLEGGLFSDDKKTLNLQLCEYQTLIAAPAATVRQILINLLRNAAECLDDLRDGGEVTIRTAAPIWQNGQYWVELEISDTGNGLPPDIQKHLFSPVNSTKGRSHGGLGLSVVKKLVDDVEGIINCRTGNSGTTFKVLFAMAEKNELSGN